MIKFSLSIPQDVIKPKVQDRTTGRQNQRPQRWCTMYLEWGKQDINESIPKSPPPDDRLQNNQNRPGVRGTEGEQRCQWAQSRTAGCAFSFEGKKDPRTNATVRSSLEDSRAKRTAKKGGTQNVGEAQPGVSSERRLQPRQERD